MTALVLGGLIAVVAVLLVALPFLAPDRAPTTISSTRRPTPRSSGCC